MPTALLSVSDKTGLVDFAQRLLGRNFTLISTGGTYRILTEAGLEVSKVSDVTGFPEILGGRVKTLHPKIHGGLLAKRSAEHLSELGEHGIGTVDLVAANLYPFRETVAREDVDEAEALENIDIGGPTMLRAAAKNYPHVTVVVDPADYDNVAAALENETLDEATRRHLARKAFAHTAAYDAAIAGWFAKDEALPPTLHLALTRAQTLRYGENPHQQAARYSDGSTGWWDGATQHKGADLSYLNLFDTEAAWRLVSKLSGPACVIVKHANPCGVALGGNVAEAYERAFACDPKSAFGGIVTLNIKVDEATAEAIMANPKADVLVAPGYSEAALERLTAKRKNMRVLSAPPPGSSGLSYRRVDGGFIVQTPDEVALDRSSWRVVTERQPSEQQWRDLRLAWLVCAHTSSNAIVFVKDEQAVAVGAGQQSRVDASELAAKKAAGRAEGGACASDAFYPFRDGLDAAAAAGIKAVIQPGGSVNDDKIIAAANEHGIAMVITGRRHFKH